MTTDRETAGRGRYTGAAQALHWLTAAFLFLMLPFVWVAENFPPGDTRTFWYLLHESSGICIFLLVIARLTWRFRHPAPPVRDPAGLAALARVNHWGLYAVLTVMPVSGYIIAANGQGVPFFGLFSLPGYAKDDALAMAADTVHVWTQFAVYALVLMHLAGTAWHVAVRRDGTLDRMLPPQDGVPDRGAAGGG